MSWNDFRAHVLKHLENPQAVQLTCKVLGDTGKASYLKDEDDFNTTMERLCQRAMNARTRAVSLEVKNIVCLCLRNESQVDSHDTPVGKTAH